MSRIGKKPIVVPDGVEVKLVDQNATVKGPKGTLELDLHSKVTVDFAEVDGRKVLEVKPTDLDDKESVAMWGTTRALLANIVQGVTEGFKKSLEVVGVGYKVNMKGKNVVFEVGYSHPVEYNVPEGIEITVEKNTVTICGINKQMVGKVAAEMRKIRKPEPYKGKGIKYSDEVVRRKAGKAAKSGE
ncbi:MAG: 50S ribosomal protein L6 [Candidatus Uhrbacteria bacterium]|nr:50S ribosomal protein L6 [Patescibacteria group bacterium]